MTDQQPKSVRHLRSLERIRAAKARRAAKTIRFYQKLARRLGLELESSSCQVGAYQVVARVIKAGHGWFYTSSLCTGCGVGYEILGREVGSLSPAAMSKKKNTVLNEAQLQNLKAFRNSICGPGSYSVLFSKEEVVPGQVLFGKFIREQFESE